MKIVLNTFLARRRAIPANMHGACTLFARRRAKRNQKRASVVQKVQIVVQKTCKIVFLMPLHDQMRLACKTCTPVVSSADKWSTDYPLSGIYPRRFAAIIRYPSPRKDVYPLSRAPALRALNVISGALSVIQQKKSRSARLSVIPHLSSHRKVDYPLSVIRRPGPSYLLP